MTTTEDAPTRRRYPWPIEFYRSAVGKKWVMALTGIALLGYIAAHMIGNLLTGFPECSDLMHGEKVAFGVVSQLCLDPDVSTAEAYAIFDWCIAVGLPVTLAGLGLEGAGRERLKAIGDVCAGEGSLCAHHAFEVTSDGVVDAMLAADALGRERKRQIGRAHV